MTETMGKKALSLCILRVLEQHAHKDAPLSTRQIIEHLEADYGMVAERKSVGRNLLLLAEMGFPLSTYQENGRGYFLTAVVDPRLQATSAHDPVTLDAFLRAPASLTAKVKIEQLQDDVPIYAANETPLVLTEALLHTISVLKDAIRRGVQVSFLYNVVQPDGSMAPQRPTPFVVSPYALFLAEGRYNVIVAMSGYGRLLHYRCDLCDELVCTDVAARPQSELSECENGLDMAAYVARTVFHSPEAETHTLLCSRHLAGELFDAFGAAVTLTPEGDTIRASVDAPWTAVRRFLLLNLRHATLLAPAWRQKQLREDLSSALATYPQA